MLDELNKIKKEEFEIINTYIKENIDDLNISINDEEAELASLNEEIRQKLLSGEYSDISNLSIEANKVDKEIYNLKENLRKSEDLIRKINGFISNPNSLDLNEQTILEEEAISLNDDELKNKIIKFRRNKLNFIQHCLSETIEELKMDIEDAQADLAFFDTNSKKMLSKYKWEELSKLASQANLAKTTLYIKQKMLEDAKGLYDEIEDCLSDVNSKLIKRILASLEEDTFNLMNAVKNFDYNNIKKPEEKNEEIDKIEAALKDVETNLDIDKLNQIRDEISLLKDEKEKERLLKKVEEIETKIKEQKIKKVEEKIKVFEGSKGMADFVDANNALKALDDCPEKADLIQRLNCAQLEMKLNCLENEIASSEEIQSEDVEEAIEVYRSLKDENRRLYKDRLNEVISYYNKQQQYSKQVEELEEKPKKYGFFTKFSEFVAGGLINSITASKFYRKHLQKKLEKAEEKSDDKKKQKIENKINQIGIVNGIRLFVNRNRIASLKPKLCKENQKLGAFGRLIQNIRTKRYDKAVSYVSDKMSKKLYKLSQDSSTFENKVITKNVINQYLDNLSMTNDIEVVSKEADDFIKEAGEKGIIENCERAAYNQEIKDILDFRKENEDYIVSDYVIEQDELDNMIKYYDEDSLSNEIWCLKK